MLLFYEEIIMNSSLTAVKDHRRPHLQPTAHIVQVSCSVSVFRKQDGSATISCADKPTHHCQSTVCNEQ